MGIDIRIPRYGPIPLLHSSVADQHGTLTGGAIMVASMLLFETDFVNIVAIAFTATILNELVMVWFQTLI